MGESSLESNFDERIVSRLEGRLEVRWTNRASDRSSMDESSLVISIYQHSDNGAPRMAFRYGALSVSKFGPLVLQWNAHG